MRHSDNDNNQELRFLSVCSGIEAASVAWGPLGWKAIGFAEIDKAASAVLAHHYPNVPNYGDFSKIDTTKLGRVDILCGGCPCQSFSIAGLRGSLEDDRGNLTLAFVRLAHELAAGNGLRNAIYENVPGILSTKDNAFGCFLAGLVGADAAIVPPGRGKWTSHGMVAGPKGRAAWAVKDAQFFGLAQRRKRVLVVADFGNGADPAAVLFEPEGVFRYPPARGEAGEGVAPTLSARTKGGGGLGTDFDLDGGLVETYAIQERAVSENPNSGPDGKGFQPDIAYTLEARSNVQSVAYAPEIARCVATREGSSQDFESTTMVAQQMYSIMPQNSGKDYKARPVDVAQPIMASGPVGGNQGGDVICITGEISHALKAEGADASEDGTGRGTPIIAFDTTQITSKANYSNPKPGDPCHPLAAGAHPPAVTVALRGREGGATAELGGEVATALRASSGGGDKPHVLTSAVRRLTPRECERLMGFPDDYTRIPVRRYDKPRITRLRPADMWSLIDGEWWLMAADGPRYKQLGNSWAVPKFRWLGERIARFMPAATTTDDNDNKQDSNAAAA